LRDNNKKLALCFSGGYDSTYLFKKAVDNNISFDQVLTCTIEDIDLPHAEEVKYNVFPWVKDYPDTCGEFVFHNPSLQVFKDNISDPNYIFTEGCYNMPKFCLNQWVGFTAEEDYTYIRVETNPSLIYKDKKWYAAVLNKNFSHSAYLPLSSFWVDPENIISFLSNALKTRNYVLENYKVKDSPDMQMFRPSNEELFDVLGFVDLYTPGIQGPKHTVTRATNTQGFTRGKKDLQFMEFLVRNREDILTDILRGHDLFNKICNITIDKQPDVVHDSGKFPWLIDLDTFELFRQSDVFK